MDDLSPDHIRHRIIAPPPPPLSLSPMSPGDGDGFFSHDPDPSLSSLIWVHQHSDEAVEHSRKLYKNIVRIYEEEDCFDVTLVSNEGGEVRAHRVILAAQSDYFKAMFRIEKNSRVSMNNRIASTLSETIFSFSLRPVKSSNT